MKKQAKYIIAGVVIVLVLAAGVYIRNSNSIISKADLQAAIANGKADYTNPAIRKAVLQYAIQEISMTTPQKIDPLTTLVSVTSDYDREIFYNYQIEKEPVNFAKIKPLLAEQLKNYWCVSPQTLENRKMGIVATYIYTVAASKKEIAHLSIDTRACQAK